MSTRARSSTSSSDSDPEPESIGIRREESHINDPYRPSTVLKINVQDLKQIAHDICESAKTLKTLNDDIVRKRNKTSSKELGICEQQYDYCVKDLTRELKKLKSCLSIRESDGQKDELVYELQEEVKSLKVSIREEQAYADDAEEMVFVLEREVDYLTNEVRREKASKDNAHKIVSELQEEVNNLIRRVRDEEISKDEALERVSELQEVVNNLIRRVRDEETSKDEALERVSELQEEVNNLIRRVRDEETSKDEALERVLGLEQDIDSLRRRVRDKEIPKDEDDKLRLSEPLSTTLHYNNFSEISDNNRPTKLAEKASEMFDNEWMDAFDEMENIFGYTENELIDFLLKALMDIFAESRRVTTDGFFERIQACIEHTDVMQASTVYEPSNIPNSLRQQIKDLRKVYAVKDMEGVVEGILKQHGLEYLRRPPYNSKNIREYLKKCVEVSWLMCVQDPPLTLSTDKPIEFDEALYKEHTKPGRYIAFVVWPILYLYEGGPILCKGVAQGSDELPQVTPIQDLPVRSSPDKKHDRTDSSSPQNQLHNLNAVIPQLLNDLPQDRPRQYPSALSSPDKKHERNDSSSSQNQLHSLNAVIPQLLNDLPQDRPRQCPSALSSPDKKHERNDSSSSQNRLHTLNSGILQGSNGLPQDRPRQYSAALSSPDKKHERNDSSSSQNQLHSLNSAIPQGSNGLPQDRPRQYSAALSSPDKKHDRTDSSSPQNRLYSLNVAICQGSNDFPQVTPRPDPSALSGPDRKHDRTDSSSPQNQLHSLNAAIPQGSNDFPQVTLRQDPSALSSPDKRHDRTDFNSPQNQLHSLNATISQVSMSSMRKGPQPYGYKQGQRNKQMQHRPVYAPLQYSSNRQVAETTDLDVERQSYDDHLYVNIAPHRMNSTN